MSGNGALEEAKVPLIEDLASAERLKAEQDDHNQSLTERVWIESKKLRRIVGPAIFSRPASYSMLVITQAFAGHLGDLELAAISIANNVIVDFDFGLLLGMASALETLCGQAFGAKKYYMLEYTWNVHVSFFSCVVFCFCLYIYLLPQSWSYWDSLMMLQSYRGLFLCG